MPPDNELHELQRLARENNRIAQENRTILLRMQRNARIAFWFRLVWIAILIGVPILLYFYFIEPVVDSLGDIGQFNTDGINFQIQELDGLLDNFRN